MAKIKKLKIRKAFQATVIILILLNYDVTAELGGLADVSGHKDLYGYLGNLPKDTLIAAHPRLADNIPLFAERKVFINEELSHPYFDNYWKIIKKRTYDFFDAYYSEDALFIYKFCKENEIDYLIIDENHFSQEYLRQGNISFEPFNTYVINITRNKQKFALKNIREEDKLFVQNGTFVLKADTLERYKK